MKELQLLVDDTKFGPAIDTDLFPPAPVDSSSLDVATLWSSSIDLSTGGVKWAMKRRTGIYLSGTGTSGRCVR